MRTPTEQAYTELQHAYDFFNTHLFAGALPPCLITFQRKNRTYGYFSGARWDDQAGAVTDEIALHPAHFATRSTEDVLSTLVHEMVHLWQHHHGTPSRVAYHNKEWAAKMDAIGLGPSDTGQPGGKRTGQHMNHYVVPHGAYARACAALLQQGFDYVVPHGAYARACAALLQQGFVISWRDRVREEDATGKTPGKSGVRIKYTCPDCGVNAWAKADVVLLCGECAVALESETAAP